MFVNGTWTNPNSSVECYKLVPIATYCVILFIVALSANLTLIWILLKNKELLHNANILILALSVLNTIGTVLELPLVSVSAILCKYNAI